MSNIYHIMDFIPGIEREEMISGYENLAEQVVKSGRFRIDAGDKINFARLYIPNLDISLMFSYREVHDPELIPRTKQIIGLQLKNAYNGKALEMKIDEYMDMLKGELKKYFQVSLGEEMQLARLVVQAAHPVVIMLVLLDKAEIFLSHSYNIGDMLDVVNWHTSGQNSGMQSTDGRDVAVFISCGGDPLKENADKNATYGDGWPAIARLLIIGGQELGHYSDIMRDEAGRQISRYSANFSGTMAKQEARIGRINDIKRSKDLLARLNINGLEKLIALEKDLKFYKENKKYGLKMLKIFFNLKIIKFLLIKRSKKDGILFIERFKYEERMGFMMQSLIKDMLFNLSPKADVYSRDDKDEEEAIACIEAVARVPQQANKWGHQATRACMQDLYKLYYGTIIPGCIRAYENISQSKYYFDRSKIKPGMIYTIKRLFKKRSYPPRTL